MGGPIPIMFGNLDIWSVNMIFNQGVFMKVTLSVTRCLGFVRKTAELERFAFCREKCNFSVLYINQTYIWAITTVRENMSQ